MRQLLVAVAVVCMAAPAAAYRTLAVDNLCSEPVWVGFATGGDSWIPWGQDGNPTTNSAIPAGQKRIFNTPAAPAPGETGRSVTLNVFVRTGCDDHGAQCKTADCAAGEDGICTANGQDPHAQVEITLSSCPPDSPDPTCGGLISDNYDLSVMNGATVPMALSPDTVVPLTSDNPAPAFWCGSPGAAQIGSFYSDRESVEVQPCASRATACTAGWSCLDTVNATNDAVSLCVEEAVELNSNWRFDFASVPAPSEGSAGRLFTAVDYPDTVKNLKGADCSTEKDGVTPCTQDSDCGGSPGTVCGFGLGRVSGTNQGLFVCRQAICGQALATLTPQLICAGLDPAAYSPDVPPPTLVDYFQCAETPQTSGCPNLPAVYESFSQLIGCAPSSAAGLKQGGSCWTNTLPAGQPGYQGPPDAECCGCANWKTPQASLSQEGFVPMNYPPYDQCAAGRYVETACSEDWGSEAYSSCLSQAGWEGEAGNCWQREVQPTYDWLGAALPSAYHFAYDDKSGGFSCNSKGFASPYHLGNDMSYTVTLCPEPAAGALAAMVALGALRRRSASTSRNPTSPTARG